MKIKFDNAYEVTQTMLAKHETDFHPGRSDYGSEEECDDRGSHPDPPPSTLACPLVEVANPRYGTLLGDGSGRRQGQQTHNFLCTAHGHIKTDKM